MWPKVLNKVANSSVFINPSQSLSIMLKASFISCCSSSVMKSSLCLFLLVFSESFDENEDDEDDSEDEIDDSSSFSKFSFVFVLHDEILELLSLIKEEDFDCFMFFEES